MHCILIHSTGGDSQEAFFPWLKSELEKLGHQVSAPEFPNSIEPDPIVAVPILLETYDPEQKTVLVGRSSGGTFIPHFLEQDGIVAELAVSLAAPFDDLGWNNLKKLFAKIPDFEKARSSVGPYHHWYSDDDPYVPLEHAKEYQQALGGEIRVFEGYSHFYNEAFPELLDLINNFVARKEQA